MIPDKNPFRPSFGASPVQLAGREFEISSFNYGLLGGVGAMQRALLVSGTRGVGKTVLLNEFEESARRLGWVVIRAYADAQMVAQLRDSTIPEAIEELDYTETPGRKITGFSVAGVGSVTTQLPHNQAQPSLVSRLRSLLKAARAHDAGVLLTVDEVQAASVDELAQLATAIQDLIRDEYDIAFAAAGLTFGVEELLEHEGTTFLRRAQRLDLGLLDDATVAETLHSTATAAGRGFSERALKEATALVQGYPYLLQLVGALAWTRAVLDGADAIEERHVSSIAREVPAHMGNQVHKIALKNVPDAQRAFLNAMAELESEHGADIPTGAIAAHLGKTPNAISMARKLLLERDLIASRRYGTVRFLLPYLGEYLRGQAPK